jgi:hypothetical protein
VRLHGDAELSGLWISGNDGVRGDGATAHDAQLLRLSAGVTGSVVPHGHEEQRSDGEFQQHVASSVA